ncbi:uncharacterized protein [Euwallacea fornicatus]|uniref:uncharacterized protein n=1 Tax=Euwallacea fornicatus TaxID=995702 RepID=UPI0033900DD4
MSSSSDSDGEVGVRKRTTVMTLRSSDPSSVSDSERDSNVVADKTAASRRFLKRGINNEELSQLIESIHDSGKRLYFLIQQNTNTKRHIKEEVNCLNQMTKKLFRNKSFVLEEAKKALRKRKAPTVSTQTEALSEETKEKGLKPATREVAIQATPETREMITQTEEPSTLTLLPQSTAFQDWKQLAEKKWDKEIFATTELVQGSPLTNDKPEESMVVLVDLEDQKMANGIQKEFLAKFPLLSQMEDLEFLQLTTTIGSSLKRKSKTEAGQAVKVYKTLLPKDEEGIFKAMAKLEAATKAEKTLALHQVKNLSADKFLKLVQFLFRDPQRKIRIFTEPGRQRNKSPQKTETSKLTVRVQKIKSHPTYAIVVGKKESVTPVATIKKIRTCIGNNGDADKIKSIRTNGDGNLIITLDKNVTALESLGMDIRKTMGKDNVCLLKERSEKSSIVLKGLDATVTKEDVVEAILDFSNGSIQEYELKVGELRPYARSEQAVTIRLDEKIADHLVRTRTLRIGMTRCKIEEHLEIVKCNRCWAYDHRTPQCKNADKRKACFRCGKEEHLSRACKKKEVECVCILCDKKGHYAGSGKCPKFREALAEAKEERRRKRQEEDKRHLHRTQVAADLAKKAAEHKDGVPSEKSGTERGAVSSARQADADKH